MQLLILFIGENERFDQNKLVDIVKNIPGIENIREGEFVSSILEFEFREEAHTDYGTDIRIKSLLQCF
ncbi:MAG: hypothetical protein F6K48_28625 [Okeania sp. SIO3H1]|uniref:hypothetical protein n=1 Tax=Okeania sp. SIO1I7 TaxID=2607772 RepID=UPI0013C7E9E3|nr:hypothetical protein [Okeania sp. SIO1I7]NEN92650.1 hypothetical protein [Okeania sp. SIO3H1]NET25663.1 hypothetical protein [Okeania sp. SIO1I7]